MNGSSRPTAARGVAITKVCFNEIVIEHDVV
jgi:hypothetical protein